MLPTVIGNALAAGTARARSCALAVLLLAPAFGGPADAGAQARPASAAGTATIVRVQQVEPRRVLRCDSPVPPVPNAPGPPLPPDVAAAAAVAAVGTRTAAAGAPSGPRPGAGSDAHAAATTGAGSSAPAAGAAARPPGSNARGVAAATAAAIIAADAIQQPLPATNVPGARNCVATLVPPITQWRVEYFLAGRYHRAWFVEKPAPDLTLAELLQATEAQPR